MESSGNPILTSSYHGKANVRFAKVVRRNDGWQDIIELVVSVQLFGGTDESFLEGNNCGVVATDTCRNHVYLHAKTIKFNSLEHFAIGLGDRFLNTYDHVESVKVGIEETPWKRAVIDGDYHQHGFIDFAHGVRRCSVSASRNSISLLSSLHK